MAKGLCPGVGQSLKKESVEKRGRQKERERDTNIPWGTWKTLHRVCTAHEGTEYPLEEVLKDQVGK